MATLRQNEPGTSWFLDYRDPGDNNKRYRVNTGLKDKKLAALWLNKCEELLALVKMGVIEKVGEIDADVVAGKPQKKGRTSITLEAFKVKYEDRCRHDLELSASSITLNNLALNSFIRVVGNKTVGELTDEDVVAWKRRLVAEGISRTTLGIYHRQLRAALNRAIKWDMAEKNPFTVVEVAREQKEGKPTKDMSLEDVRVLLKAIENAGDVQFGNYIRFLLYTGCRRNEILYLKWEDLDLQNGAMKVYSQKTRRSMVIPINKALRRAIQGMQTKESGYIFQSQSQSHGAKKKQQPWHKDFVTHRLKEYVHAAGLPPQHSLHSLRHTYITFLRSQGIPLENIQRLVGHASPLTTAQNYDHSIALHFRQQADLVDFEAEDA